MTLRAPEEKSVLNWAFEGLNLKSIVLYTVLLCSGFYSLKSQQVEADAKIDDVIRRQEKQSEAIKGKVDKDAYVIALQEISDELKAIRDGQGRMETILMERPNP